MEVNMKLTNLIGAIALLAVTSVFAAQPVNINTADAQMLASSIQGIGPSKAQAIVAYRNKNGLFQSVADLAKVKGIGDKTVLKNQKNLSIGSITKP